MLDRLHSMRVFAEVADSPSFVRAAATLGVTSAVVARHVRALETHLGTQLVRRSAHALSLTEAGAQYAQGCRRIVEAIDAADAEVARASREVSGTLRVVASAAFSVPSITPLLQRYRRQHPKVKLDVTLLHGPADLVERGVDVAILLPDQITSDTLIRRPLCRIETLAVASPAYLQTYGAPRKPTTLAAHTLLAAPTRNGQLSLCFRHSDGSDANVDVAIIYSSNDTLMLREAALADMGIAFVPGNIVETDLACGRLMRVLPHYRILHADYEIALVYPARQHLSAKTRVFIDMTVAYFRSDARTNALSP